MKKTRTQIGHALAALACATLLGCSGGSDTRARRVTPNTPNMSPAALRGTIGSEATLRGSEPVIVSGIGFVVGLKGSGGLPLPEEYAATIQREMGLQGIGRSNDYEGTAIDGMTARQLVSDPNTAVVLVQGAVPPGSRAGDSFDVFVRALNATSLEGGTLWTSELRPGVSLTFGTKRALTLARARGPIFVNPFADPDETRSLGVISGEVGRILDGGSVSDDLQVELVLNNPSHSRARQVVSAINSRFPERSGDRGPIARGENEAQVRVTVPRTHKDRPVEFFRLIGALQIDRAFPEVYARRYAQTMRSEPYLADEMGWCLEAIGPVALPEVRSLYDAPELPVRLAALRAGVGLGDEMTTPALLEMASEGPVESRSGAIELLSRLEGGPRVDITLREMMAARELTTRVAAYEALRDRAERTQRRRLASIASEGRGRNGERSYASVVSRAKRSLPEGTIHGVSREVIEDKFYLDRAPVGEPLIYVAQQGEPRIVLFGEDLSLRAPSLASAWDDRFLLTTEQSTGGGRGVEARVYYRGDEGASTETVAGDLDSLIRVLAGEREGVGGSGFGMSYAQVVGALYRVHAQGAVGAAFSTERDRLIAELARTASTTAIEVRPERPGETPELVVFEPSDAPRARPEGRQRDGLVVPLNQPVGAGDPNEEE